MLNIRGKISWWPKNFFGNLLRLCSIFYPFLFVYQHQKQLLRAGVHPLTTFLKQKPNTKEGLELENTRTVDKLTFIRLNGPPPGIYKSALVLMFKGDCTSHFLHIGRNLKATLIVVDRILSSNERITMFFKLVF